MIAINADRNGKDFGQNTIFTGNNDKLPGELTSFLQQILNENEILFISEEDYLLHQTYIDEFGKNNIMGILAWLGVAVVVAVILGVITTWVEIRGEKHEKERRENCFHTWEYRPNAYFPNKTCTQCGARKLL